jgi:hypothetical protein
MTVAHLRALLTWARARSRYDQRGVVDRGVLTTLLVIAGIVALVLWIVTSFGVHKK